MTQDSSAKITMDEAKQPFFTKAMLHNGRMNIKQNKKLFIILLILHMAALPLVLGMLLMNILTTGTDDVDSYIIIAVLTTGGAAAAGIICALSTMNYLYKKSLVDMHFSLPMTTSQRFVSDFLSGLFIYIVPYIISEIISFILLGLGHILCDGKTFYRYNEYNSDHSSWECTAFEDAAPILIKGIIGGLFLMIMFYVFTVLVASCCGSLFESITYTIFANGFVPGMIAAVIAAVTDNVNGLDAEFYMARYLTASSPIGGAIGLVAAMESGAASNASVPLTMTYSKWLISLIVMTVIYGIGAFLIYRKRRAEDTGKPIVFDAFYHVIMTMCMVTVCFLIFMEYNSEEILLPMIITTGIIYLVLNVIKNRGFSHIGKGILGYVVTIGLSIGSFFLMTATGGFGAENYVPEASQVSTAYISYSGYYNEMSYHSFGGLTAYNNYYCPSVKDRDNIAIVTSTHQSIVDEMKNADNVSYYKYGNFRVLYKMKSGKYVLREYSLTKEAREILSGLDMTDEFKEQICNDFDWRMSDPAEYGITDINDMWFRVKPQWTIASRSTANYQQLSYTSLPKDFITQLRKCYREDIMAMTEADYYRNSSTVWLISANYGNDIFINEHFTKTVAYLDYSGFDMYSGPVYTDDVSDIINTFDFYITESDGVKTSSTYYDNVFAKVCVCRDMYADILSSANKMNKTENGSYTISVNGNEAVIPAYCNELAEKAYIQTVADEFVRRGIVELYNYYDYNYGAGKDQIYDELDYLESDLMKIYDMQSKSYYDYYTQGSIEDYSIFLKDFTSRYGQAKIDSTGYEDIYRRMTEWADKFISYQYKSNTAYAVMVTEE